MHFKRVKGIIYVFLCLLQLTVSCSPAYEIPEKSDQFAGWENEGKINASFIASGRSVASTSNTGSPSLSVSYIATAPNVDSVLWQFPGGNPVSSTLIQQDVTYSNFGTYDVGLRVSNLDDTDYRFLENYVRLYYKDDWSFGADSWSVTGTTAVTDFVPYVDKNGSSWIYVPHTIENEAKCVKSFTGFPSNKLDLEFEYKLERIPELYIATNYQVSSTSITVSGTTQTTNFTLTNLVSPTQYVEATATPTPTKFTSPTTYPGQRRLILNYNNIPIWTTSRMTEGTFRRVKLSLPSLANFNLSYVISASTKNSSGVIEYPFRTDIRNMTIKFNNK